MPTAAKPPTLVEAVTAALKAAKAHKPRNEGDRSETDLVVNMLSDCLAHAGQLDELADSYERAERLRLAEDELRKAQSA